MHRSSLEKEGEFISAPKYPKIRAWYMQGKGMSAWGGLILEEAGL